MLERWVTYIYRYHADKREDNVGFIKAQKVGCQTKEKVRFQVGIKMYKSRPCKCTIYLVDGDAIHKVKDLIFSAHDQDSMMLRFEIPWWSPVGLGKAVTDYKGLYFLCEDGECCAGFWYKEEDYFVLPRLEMPAVYVPIKGAKETGETYVASDKIKEWHPKPITARSETYEKILNGYTRLPLYSNNKLIDCVKIMPQDIGKLPIANWKLGTNSFVTHGFYHYQYLMLGNVMLEDEKRLVLGIPGVYTSKEKYVANMFGFAKFVPVKQCDYLTGQFGYWIVEVITE